MKKTFSESVGFKFRRVIISYFSFYDGRVHRKIFKDSTRFEALAAFYVMSEFHCWTLLDYYCIRY